MTNLSFDVDHDNFHLLNNSNEFGNDDDDLDEMDDDKFLEEDLDDLDEDYLDKNVSDYEKEDDIEDLLFGIEPGQEDIEFDDEDPIDFDDEI